MDKKSDSQKKTNQQSISRRQFLTRTTVATAGAVAFPMIVPASALGLDGTVAPSNRINMGCIGVGSQGTGNLGGFLNNPNMHFLAVADVERPHRNRAKKMIDQRNENTDCDTYNDFRDLLERDDLDALSIAVPDHWHSIPAIQAANKGLDMYAEKPLALTIAEGRAMVDAVQENKVVWQTGSWQRSQSHFRHACELVRNGYIGEVHKVEVGLPTGNPLKEPTPPAEVPDGFDYDFWLGPAPWAPYTKLRCHWNFRWILDYSGGQLTDWAAHHCDIFNWGMGTEATGPLNAEGTGNFPREGIWDAAMDYMIKYNYAPGASPVAPKGFELHVSNSFGMGARFYGSEGEIYVKRGKLVSKPGKLKDIEIKDSDTRLYKSTNHGQNFVDCVRSREKCIAPIEAAHHAIAIAHLGNISMRLGRKVQWDAKKEEFVNDPQADRMLKRAMRGEWHI